MKKIFSILNIYFCFYFLLICFIAVFAYKKPHYNWDMLAYMALVVRMDNSDIKTVHDITYNSAKENVPEREYGYLIGNESRRKIAMNPGELYKLLPFYAIKPLYTGIVYLFYKAGFSLPMATIMPSIFSYLLMGGLLFYWLKNYLNPLMTFLSSLLIMYSGFMISIARESTPDALSAFLLFSAFYFIIQKPAVIFLTLFLVLSIFARLDNFITGTVVVSFLFFSKKSPITISIKQFSFILFLFLLAYFSTSLLLRPFNWNMFFYPTFVQSFNLPGEQNGIQGYLALAYSKIITAIVYHNISLFAMIVLFIVNPLRSMRLKTLNFIQAFSLLLLLIIGIRFLLFPDLSDRFNIAFFLCGIVLLIKQYRELLTSSKKYLIA